MVKYKLNLKLFLFLFAIVLLGLINFDTVFAEGNFTYQTCIQYAADPKLCDKIDMHIPNQSIVNSKDIAEFITRASSIDRGNEDERKEIQSKAFEWIQSLIKSVVYILISLGTIYSLYVIVASIIQISASADMPFFRKQATEKLLKATIILVIIPSAYFIFYAAIYFFAS